MLHYSISNKRLVKHVAVNARLRGKPPYTVARFLLKLIVDIARFCGIIMIKEREVL